MLHLLFNFFLVQDRSHFLIFLFITLQDHVKESLTSKFQNILHYLHFSVFLAKFYKRLFTHNIQQ